MLYDNAQLARVYTEAYVATGERRFAETARQVLDYVAREMTTPDGAFHSATDADSPTGRGHDEEGLFFTWTPAELAAALEPDAVRAITLRYGVTERGNFEGRNILYVARTIDDVAREMTRTEPAVRELLEEARRRLYAVRSERRAPHRDDKVVTAWNGLMLNAFALAARVFDDSDYRATSARAARFLLRSLRGADGRLRRTYMDGEARHAAYLEDYAASIEGLLTTFEATHDPTFLDGAIELQRTLDRHHHDDARGAYYQTAHDAESLLVRDKPTRDGALPSGNALAALNLVRLAAFTGDGAHRRRVERLFAALAPEMARYPAGYCRLLVGLDAYHDRFLEVVIVTPEEGDPAAAQLLARERRAYVPNRALVVTPGSGVAGLTARMPWVRGKRALEGRPTAYVCEQGRCELPTSDPARFAEQMTRVRPYAPPPAGLPPIPE